jgi:cellulose synthase (UDP-forming)
VWYNGGHLEGGMSDKLNIHRALRPSAPSFAAAAAVCFAIALCLVLVPWNVASSQPLGQIDGTGTSQSAGWFEGSALLGGPLTGLDAVISALALIALLILAARYRGTSGVRWVIIVLSSVLAIRYLVWRGLFTLNVEEPVGFGLSLALFLAELYGFGGTLFFYMQTYKSTPRTIPLLDPMRCPTVDVFVTIFDEPVEVLKPTLVACKAMKYPADRKKVYVLDDGARAEVRQLAASLGCIYLSRSNRAHAKAGNLNHALAQSAGDIVVTFDTDHVPVRTFLTETLGAFEDEKVAFVQTPHYFSNPDIFQRNLRLENQLVNEQNLFFRVVQPGRDARNSAFYTGSGGIFRRRCLEEIGGFATESVTEDIHTSILLHAKGYRSIFFNKVLTSGLAPETYTSFLTQRQRWARGAFQIFLSRHNPLLIPGLTMTQRLDYFASMYYFLHGPARLIYITAPLALLLFGHYVIFADPWTLLTLYATAYAGTVVAFSTLTRGYCNPFWADVYETVMSFYLTGTVIGSMLFRKRSVFHVTPKGVRSGITVFRFLPSLPYLVLSVALAVGIGMGLVEIFQWHALDSAIVVSMLWAGYNLLVCATAAAVAREQPQRRTAPRLERDFSCQLVADSAILPAKAVDLSETGVRLVHNHPRSLPEAVEVRLVDTGSDQAAVKGRVVRNDLLDPNRAVVGIEFKNLSERQLRDVILQMYCDPSLWTQRPAADTSAWRSLFLLGTSLVHAFGKDIQSLRRRDPRSPLEIPCEVIARDVVLSGATENISQAGLLIRLREGSRTVPEVCSVRLIPGSDVLTFPGRIVWKAPKGMPVRAGVRLDERVSPFLISWMEFAKASRAGAGGTGR